MTDLTKLSQEQLIAMITAMKATGQRKITFKVTAKKADGTGTDGALSLYGLGRFPVTLYKSQWERLLSAADDIHFFIAANSALLKEKE